MATELNGLLNQTVSIKTMLHHIMSQYLRAKQESFGGHPLGNYVRKIVPDELAKLPFIDARYIIEGSVGRGNWAKVPWIAILDQRMTTTVQKGIYIVYLFAENMESVYLTLNQGVTIPIQELGRLRAYQYFAEQARKIRAKILLEVSKRIKIFMGLDKITKHLPSRMSVMILTIYRRMMYLLQT